jgi:Na+-driven multidrug efflux pump
MLLCLFSNVFKADELGLDIALIALPAVIALAADPLSSLVDTAFVGKIGNIFLYQALRRLMLSIIDLDIRGSFCTM